MNQPQPVIDLKVLTSHHGPRPELKHKSISLFAYQPDYDVLFGSLGTIQNQQFPPPYEKTEPKK